jgi:hypothetical protein
MKTGWWLFTAQSLTPGMRESDRNSMQKWPPEGYRDRLNLPNGGKNRPTIHTTNGKA